MWKVWNTELPKIAMVMTRDSMNTLTRAFVVISYCQHCWQGKLLALHFPSSQVFCCNDDGEILPGISPQPC